MRRLIDAALVSSFLLPLIPSAEAQSARLPRKSRSERQVEEINRNLRLENRLRQLDQQYQTDHNQLRQSFDRERAFSNPRSRIGTCPSGSISC